MGYGAYAVGGFVRDLLLRHDNLDIDVVVEGDGIHFAETFAAGKEGIRVRAHRKFNTAVLIWEDGFKVDVTTARLEWYESPGALPIVEGGSIQLDLYRRDFTINTLAVSLSRKSFGVVIDYYRGLRDLKDGFIRVLHNLSFVEDPTRVFRAIRFEQRFGFKIGKLTTSLLQNAVKHNFFSKLSGKRLSGEIRLILKEDDPAPAMERLAEFGLLEFLHPKLTFGKKTRELFRRIKKVRDWFDITYPNEKEMAWMIYFLGLVDGLEKPDVADFCRRLSLLKKETQILVEEKPEADLGLGNMIRKRKIKPSEIYDILHPLSTETILFMMARTDRAELTRTLSDYFTKWRRERPITTGNDLIKMGFSPGPDFKVILGTLLEKRLNGELVTRKDELNLVRKHFSIAAEKRRGPRGQ